ncbi:MAG: rod shape-determining protein MreD [Chitinophagaceae bacterium]|nr:rod shape-determining protein MreD [Chitinophagaceae bacterium]
MSDLLRNTIRLLIFILLQVYVLNKIPALHQFIVPIIYYLFILWLPFSISRTTLLVMGFITGIILDFFMMTPGLHAATCVLVAYLRPFVINILAPKDAAGFSYREPSPKAMGWTPYLVYTFVLTLAHHGYLVFLEWLSFGSFFHFIIKVIATTGISMLLIIITELLFPRKLKFRTNTA